MRGCRETADTDRSTSGDVSARSSNPSTVNSCGSEPPRVNLKPRVRSSSPCTSSSDTACRIADAVNARYIKPVFT